MTKTSVDLGEIVPAVTHSRQPGDDPEAGPETLVLRGQLSLEELHRAATTPLRVELAEDSLASVGDNRAVLDNAVAHGTHIYGVTTGVGALMVQDVAVADSRAAQDDLLRSHAAGWGQPMPPEVVRASLIVRLNGLLQAHSGVRPIVLHRICDVLNSGLLPIVPRSGSLGASGDLAPSAHAFLPLIGEGELTDRTGTKYTGSQLLRTLGLDPLVLSYKEGLSLLNGTHFMAGIAAIVSVRVAELIDTADAVAAMSMEALLSAASPLDPRVHNLRRGTGQATTARNVRNMTHGSQLLANDIGGRQDPYSTRCVPQVHGASREAALFFDRTAVSEVNAVTDNPLVFPDGPQMVSAGNFHGQALALGFDTLRIALADLASISERRIFRLLAPADSHGLPAFLGDGRSTSSGYMLSQYTAAALLAELRALAHPVSCDSVPTSGGQEDHVSMGMTGALMTVDAVDRLRAILAIELVCSGQALEYRHGVCGTGTRAVHTMLRECLPALQQDRPPAADHDVAIQLIETGRIAQLIRQLEG